ncbi:MAG: folate-binding protein YgfZ [Polyangiaceae bacterium]|nr:folate-binding protein YgfZ [Polyangiaceae bacterium]
MTAKAAQAAREGALVVDRSSQGTLVVTGEDRLTWLNAIVTCEVGRLEMGAGVWGLLLNRQGKIQSDVSIVAAPDRVFVAVAPGRAETLRDSLERLLIMEEAAIFDATGALAWLFVHGPRGGAVVAAAGQLMEGAVAGRLDWLGIGGGVLIVPRPTVREAIEVLIHTEPCVAEATADDFVRLRLERGWPEFGVDYGTEDNPHQAGLDQRGVSWTKGCYLGQEVVCMAGMRGKVRRRLGSILFDQPVAPPPGTEVKLAADGTPVGEVSSSGVSETQGRGLALARVMRTALEARAAVLVGGASGRLIEGPP